MKTSKNGVLRLINSEGQILYEYDDGSGYPTISVGVRTDIRDLSKYFVRKDVNKITLSRVKPIIHVDNTVNTITEEQSLDIFKKTLPVYEGYIDEFVTVELKQNQYDMLVSLVYNIGANNFRNSSLLRNLNKGIELSKLEPNWKVWNKAKDKSGKLVVNKGLTLRRAREWKVFINGY